MTTYHTASKKLFRWLIPFGASMSLTYLGIAFVVLLPLPLALGAAWEFYGLGLVFAVGLGYWTHRTYRVTILEHTDEALMTRVERRRREAATD